MRRLLFPPRSRHIRWVTQSFLDHTKNIRNIGISAHIDSGKTTLTERVLFYAGKIKSIHEVKGGDDVGATMDSMDLERERGITIRSAATFCRWGDTNINLIDTPGHVDFTIEVERALRVLDGAVLLLCGVGGVQSQTLTVDRQMRRYGVPRVCFINKLDRDNADPMRALEMLKKRLGVNAEVVQLNIGIAQDFEGIVDIIEQKSVHFEGKFGEKLKFGPVPDYMKEDVQKARSALITALADIDSVMEEKFLAEENPTPEELHSAIRRQVIANKFIPVFMGSAYRNKGVQLLLDGVQKYLPNPLERVNEGFEVIRKKEDAENTAPEKPPKVTFETDDEKPLVAMIFKIETTAALGMANYARVYQGKLRKTDTFVNVRTASGFSVPRLVRMHASEAESVSEVKAGEICAIIGDVNAASGDTIIRSGAAGGKPVTCENIYVPPRVISASVKGEDDRAADQALKYFRQFMREDPTFFATKNDETGEILIEGMGELHLDIYVERVKREFGIVVTKGKPTVNYREIITKRVEFDFLHKRQTGGQGQFAHIKGVVEPLKINMSRETGVKNKYIRKCANDDVREALQKSLGKGILPIFSKGQVMGAPLWGVQMTLTGGSMHEVDSTDVAFKNCAQTFWTAYLPKIGPTLVEPWMNCEISCPVANQTEVAGEFSRREGVIREQTNDGIEAVITGETPLDRMFGFITDLRKATKGQGNFTMEFSEYRPMQIHKAQEVVDERNERLGRKPFQLPRD